MARYRRRSVDYPDANQKTIVEQLLDIPGVSVETGHDDILVGHRGRTYWYEIKNPEVANKDGKVFPSKIKPEQHRLNREFRGHYRIVTSFDEILEDMGL
jgi:hypothetical protein